MAVPTPEFSPDELNELLSAFMPEIPGYRVLRQLGRGGMSYVYLGVQESLDRQVAIKVISPLALKDEVTKLRFEKEARTIAKLQHPCIVSIYAVGRTEQGLLYYVLPYLCKGHLGQLDLTRNEARVVEVLRSLLWALDYAHVRGVVHRDVKAENVLFDNADRPLLTDFGIAINRRDRTRMTGGGFAIGSGAHMAPEQARGEPVDGRADLYSLGVLTYEMLCGELPYQNSEPLGLALMHAVDPVPRLPPTLRHWQAFIDKAMAKSRNDRFNDAQEMMAALDQVEALRTSQRRSGQQPALPVTGVAGLARRLLVLKPTPRQAALGLLGIAGLLLAGALGWRALSSLNSGPPAATIAAASAPATPKPSNLAPAATATAPLAVDTDAVPEAAAEADERPPPEAVEDPLPSEPGLRELALAERQILRRRLTQPPGDNAYESLRAARRLLPQSEQLPLLGERWLVTATPYLRDAQAQQRDDAVRTLFSSARTLSQELQLQDGSAWAELRGLIEAPLREALAAALADNDLGAVRAARAEITRWGLPGAQFEPLWSQAITTARPGDRLADPIGLRLLRLPDAGSAGLAMQESAVSRADYAAFVAATSRAASPCRIRTALMTLKKRRWDEPGFAQDGSHPAVCVSLADAQAYADWRGERDGQRYRLPGAAEWREHAAGSGTGCDSGTRSCKPTGTRPADAGARSSQGVISARGNVREWPGDCSAGCRSQAVLGASWRDAGRGTTPAGDSVDPSRGYDDVGFRLVREVSRSEVEQR